MVILSVLRVLAQTWEAQGFHVPPDLHVFHFAIGCLCGSCGLSLLRGLPASSSGQFAAQAAPQALFFLLTLTSTLTLARESGGPPTAR